MLDLFAKKKQPKYLVVLCQIVLATKTIASVER